MADQSRLGKDPLQGLAGSKKTMQNRVKTQTTIKEPGAFTLPLHSLEAQKDHMCATDQTADLHVEMPQASSELPEGFFLPYFELGEDGIIAFANSAFSELVGLSNLVGQRFLKACVLGRWHNVEKHACACALEQPEGRGDFMEIRGRKNPLPVTVFRRRMIAPSGESRLCCTVVDAKALAEQQLQEWETSRSGMLPRLGELVARMVDKNVGDGIKPAERFALFSDMLLNCRDMLPVAGVDIRSFLDRMAEKISMDASNLFITVEIELESESVDPSTVTIYEQSSADGDVEAIVSFEKAYGIGLACILALRMAGVDPFATPKEKKESKDESASETCLTISLGFPAGKTCVRVFDNGNDGGVFPRDASLSIQNEAGQNLRSFVIARGGAVYFTRMNSCEVQVIF